MKTTLARADAVVRNWYLMDAADQTLGRFATRVARLLMGKDKPSFTPHVDQGDFVVVLNASRIRVTGRKLTDKVYHRHTFYPGGHKQRTLKQMMERYPERVIELAVKRMLPKNRQQDRRMRRLHVYAAAEHKHQAQRPIAV
jgi:large subunit ribosomal protein L13